MRVAMISSIVDDGRESPGFGFRADPFHSVARRYLRPLARRRMGASPVAAPCRARLQVAVAGKRDGGVIGAIATTSAQQRRSVATGAMSRRSSRLCEIRFRASPNAR